MFGNVLISISLILMFTKIVLIYKKDLLIVLLVWTN